MSDITAVVFDMGGVLAHPPKGPMAPPKDFFGPSEPGNGGDHPWHRLERGELTLEEAFPLLFEQIGLPVPSAAGTPGLPPGLPQGMPPNLPQGMPGFPPMPPGGGAGPFGFPLPPPFTLEPAFVALAEELAAAGYRLALCVNAIRELETLWWDLYPWPDLFGVVIRSYEVGARKPDLPPYEAVLERLGTAPGETLFVDDSAANLETAGRLGMITVLADGKAAADLVRDLTGLAIPAPEPATSAAEALRSDRPSGARTDADRTDADQSDADQVLAGVRSFVRRLPERAAEIERARSIPRDLVEDLRDTGIFRALYPSSLGGQDLSDAQIVEAVETLAAGDASVAWCAAIGLDAALCVRAWTDEHVREVFPSPDLITAAVLPPSGRGVREEEGFRLDGEWAFASGIGHADRVLCGFLEFTEDGAPAMGAAGVPAWWIAVVEPGDVRVRDTWHTTGLRGTGSHDFEIRDLWVPERRAFQFMGPAASRTDGFDLSTDRVNAKLAGIPLGIGRAALDAAVAILRDKTDAMTRQPVATFPRVRSNVARAESLIGASRAYVYRSFGPEMRRGDAPLARQFAYKSCLEAVQLLYDTVGSASLYTERTPLDRLLRDLTTARQHMAVSDRILEGVGELRLGGNPMSPFI